MNQNTYQEPQPDIDGILREARTFMRGPVDETMADLMLDARSGDGAAALRLADMIQKVPRTLVSENEFEAYVDYIQSIYVYAAQHGSDEAVYRLALLNLGGIGETEDSDAGIYWLERATWCGRRNLWQRMLTLYMQGHGSVSADQERGRKFFDYVLEEVTKSGDINGAEGCIEQMASYLSKGIVLPEDDKRAEELYMMLVKAGKLVGLEGLEELYGKMYPDDPTKIFAARLLYGEITDDRYESVWNR